jgi:predicted transposase YbfD/YdcC
LSRRGGAVMSGSFLDHIKAVEDGRIAGMTTYPLDEVLLTILIGLLCRMEDFDEIAMFGEEQLDWLRRFLPFVNGVAPAQTLRRALRALDPKALQGAFSSWVASLQTKVSDQSPGVQHLGVVAIDGKTLRGSKRDKSGSGALHVVSAYAHEAGLVLAARAVETKSNEITAIPELLDMLALEGAVVTIDAMGTQKAIAARIVEKGADYVLACKENQAALHADVEEFFADPALAGACKEHRQLDAGHGRIEERSARAADAGWLAERHPQWKGLRSIAAIACLRTDKKTGAASKETRFYISSLSPDPEQLLAASRAHWSVENNLHWTLDVTFREDECRIRKDYSAINLAMIRHAALNILKRDTAKIPIKRKRLKAAINPDFRAALLKC